MRGIAAAMVLLAMFAPPDAEQRRLAIGDTHALPAAQRCALDPAAFEPIGAPGPSDWLANHPEPGQPFDEFVRSHPNRPTHERRVIYLQPPATLDVRPVTDL